MPKAGDPKKPNNKKPDKKPAPKPAPAKAAAKPAAKPAPKPAAKPAPKPAPVVKAKPLPAAHNGEHSAQAEKMRALYEKLHGSAEQRSNIPGQGPPGKKKGGFDANQFRGSQKGSFTGSMIRRTQSRGGGSGGGGGGGGSSGA